MTERVGFSDNGKALLATIHSYFKPLRLKKGALEFEHIVFRCGTMVRLDCTETHHTPITSFTEDAELDAFLRADFPGHRLKDVPYEHVRFCNQADLEWSLQTSYPEQCRKAYGCLMRSGYPLPGGAGADRYVLTWDYDEETGSMTFMTIFPQLGPCCCGLFHLESMPEGVQNMDDERLLRSVDIETAETRRLDYMFPKPFAFVDKNLNVHVLK